MIKLGNFSSILRILAAIAFELVLTINIHAAIRTATSSGDWETAGNWSPSAVPAFNQTNNTDDIVIDIFGNTGTYGSITLDNDLVVKGGTTLTILGCDTLIVTGNVEFKNGSYVEVEPCAVLIVQGNVTNNNNSDEIVIDGSFQVGGNFDGGNGSLVDGTGTIDIVGTITLSGTGAIGVIVLPVNLIDFYAEVNKEHTVELFWSTAQEYNVQNLTLERSENGEEWNTMQIYSTSENSASLKNYQYLDTKPVFGRSFYRLKEVSLSGQITIYDPISVFNDRYSHEVSIFPNPITGRKMNINFMSLKNELIAVYLKDINGKTLLHKNYTLNSNNETKALTIPQSIPEGIYLIVSHSSSRIYHNKIIIE